MRFRLMPNMRDVTDEAAHILRRVFIASRHQTIERVQHDQLRTARDRCVYYLQLVPIVMQQIGRLGDEIEIL